VLWIVNLGMTVLWIIKRTLKILFFYRIFLSKKYDEFFLNAKITLVVPVYPILR